MTAKLSRRCSAGQHIRCNGSPCPCDCGHLGKANARLAKAVALYDRADNAATRELLAMLGLIDWPHGREILPDDTRINDLDGLGPLTRSPDGQHGWVPPEPVPPNCTTPPGLRALPPDQDEVA